MKIIDSDMSCPFRFCIDCNCSSGPNFNSSIESSKHCNVYKNGDYSNLLTYDYHSDYYWGEISINDMQRAVKIAEAKGWNNAVEEVISANYPEIKGMILDSSRADWIKMFDDSAKNILEVGSGWGQTSVLLSDNKNHNIVSLEKIPLRAKFQSLRAAQEKKSNLNIINADIFDIKLKDSCFDIVSFIGVLEWVSANDDFSNPRDAQLHVLKKVNRALKDNGKVVIGIENRFGFNNILGALDHSGLRFTSLMPRWLADLYMKVRNTSYRTNKINSKYNTYTYSATGYIKLLADAGFTSISIKIVHPHYTRPQCIIDYDSKYILKFFKDYYTPNSIKDLCFVYLFKILSYVKLSPFLAPHYMIIGEK